MDNFSIEDSAKSYVEQRFPQASTAEKDKLINDWQRKVEVSRQLVDDFKKRIKDPAGMIILDAGCGNGGLAIAFTEVGAEIYGVDIEEELINIAKQHAAEYKVKPSFIFYEGRRLPFSDNTFSAATSISVLEHTTDPVLYLSEILRVLKPSGFLYLALPNRLWPKETHTLLWGVTYLPRQLADKLVKLSGRNPLAKNNLHFYSYWQLMKIIKQTENGQAKFKIMEEKGESASLIKKIIKFTLKIFGLSYKAFLPHLQLILRKEINLQKDEK